MENKQTLSHNWSYVYTDAADERTLIIKTLGASCYILYRRDILLNVVCIGMSYGA